MCFRCPSPLVPGSKRTRSASVWSRCLVQTRAPTGGMEGCLRECGEAAHPLPDISHLHIFPHLFSGHAPPQIPGHSSFHTKPWILSPSSAFSSFRELYELTTSPQPALPDTDPPPRLVSTLRTPTHHPGRI